MSWAFAYASVAGQGHLREGLPCQDACALDYDGRFGVAVVCDGAGSCEHGHTGARQACEFARLRFSDLVKGQGWQEGQALPDPGRWKECAEETLFAVKTDLFHFAAEENLDWKSLSCTIIVVLFFPTGLLVTHIGDGRAGYLHDGCWSGLITPYRGEVANETVFLTSAIWDRESPGQYIRCRVIAHPVDAFCLLSDGCERASFEINYFDPDKQKYYDPNRPFPNFFNPNVQALKQFSSAQKSQQEINALWADFLTAGNPKLRLETDDKTMILALRIG